MFFGGRIFYQFVEASLNLDGFAEPKSTVVLIKNGQEDGRTDVNDEGAFTLPVNLDEGENKIAVYSNCSSASLENRGKE
jgi:hypothetical protein